MSSGDAHILPHCRHDREHRPLEDSCHGPRHGDVEAHPAFDHLRVWATVGVVLLHGGAGILGARLGQESGFWSDANVANLYDALGRFAVNCFFMVSGALLLGPERGFLLVRQLRRVLVPLAVWSLVYVLADAALAARGQPVVRGSVGEPDLLAPVQLARDALSGAVAYHLWFVYVLVGLYLVTPLVRPVTALAEPHRRCLLLYALGLWLVLDVGVRFGEQMWDGFPDLYSSALPDLPTGYLGLFLLGFVLHRYRPPGGPVLHGLLATVGLTWIVLAVWRQLSQETPDLWAYDNLQPPVLLFSVGVFLLATGLLDGSARVPTAVASVSHLSFRIYLVHALVLHLLRTFGPTADLHSGAPAAGIPVVVALTLVLSYGVAWLVERVRPLRTII